MVALGNMKEAMYVNVWHIKLDTSRCACCWGLPV